MPTLVRTRISARPRNMFRQYATKARDSGFGIRDLICGFGDLGFGDSFSPLHFRDTRIPNPESRIPNPEPLIPIRARRALLVRGLRGALRRRRDPFVDLVD